jgi:hypothetical protein
MPQTRACSAGTDRSAHGPEIDNFSNGVVKPKVAFHRHFWQVIVAMASVVTTWMGTTLGVRFDSLSIVDRSKDNVK